jgi:hypothetical protein
MRSTGLSVFLGWPNTFLALTSAFSRTSSRTSKTKIALPLLPLPGYPDYSA